jgi:prevent-host-death family protein
MAQYSVGEARAQLSKLLRKAMMGEEVVIAKSNKPVLRLVRINTKKRDRKPGSGRGQLIFMADDFDAALAFSEVAEKDG